MIVTGSFDKTANVWCSRTGHCHLTLWGHDAEVVVVQFSPTQCRVATGSMDSTAKIFHLSTGKYYLLLIYYFSLIKLLKKKILKNFLSNQEEKSVR